MRKRISIVLLAVICVALLGACASVDPNEAIIGSWECRGGEPHDGWCNFTFESNGRFYDGDGDAGAYRISGTDLILDYDAIGSFTFSFSFSGNDRLTLSTEDASNPFRRVS